MRKVNEQIGKVGAGSSTADIPALSHAASGGRVALMFAMQTVLCAVTSRNTGIRFVTNVLVLHSASERQGQGRRRLPLELSSRPRMNEATKWALRSVPIAAPPAPPPQTASPADYPHPAANKPPP